MPESIIPKSSRSKIRRKIRQMSRLKKAGVLLAASAAGVAGIAGSASAHNVTVYNGQDYAYTYGTHRAVNVCDVETDGNYVYVEVDLVDKSGLFYVRDNNGSQPGCGIGPLYDVPILSLKICETGGGETKCSATTRVN